MQMCFASNACTPHRLRASGVIESVAKALRNCSATRRKLGQFGSHLGPASWSWRWFLAAASRAYYPTVLAPPCCLPRLHARRVVALMPLCSLSNYVNSCLCKHRCVIPPKTSSEIEIQVYFVVPKL